MPPTPGPSGLCSGAELLGWELSVLGDNAGQFSEGLHRRIPKLFLPTSQEEEFLSLTPTPNIVLCQTHSKQVASRAIKDPAIRLHDALCCPPWRHFLLW